MKKNSVDSKNKCFTYFAITGIFDPDHVTRLLELKPDKTWKVGDLRKNGTKYDFARWNFGLIKEYDVCVENQMYLTIAPLLNKIDLLNQLREQHDVQFTLEIVPTIYVGETTPALAPSMEIIDFCHATRTQIDIDTYVLNESDD